MVSLRIERMDRAWAMALACLFLAAPARAEITSIAKPIVEHWITASGGRDAMLADTLVHRKGRLVAEGLRGTFDQWSAGPGRLLEETNLGGTRERAGLADTIGWRTDLTTRKVTPLEGKDLEALRAEAWFAAEQWARDDQGGGHVRMGQTAYASGRSQVSLEITPPVGPMKTLWFDTETGLITRITHHRDQYAWDEYYSAWKLRAGRKRWTVAVEGDSARFAAGFVRHDVDSVRAEAPRDPAAFQPPASGTKPVTWLKTKGVARIPFHYRRGHVWIRASINGSAPADFILDTGCTMTALDEIWSRSIGLETEGAMAAQGVGGIGTGGWSRIRSLKVYGANGDGVEVPNLRAAVLGLTDTMERFDWDDTAGLVGYDFLSRFVVTIDFDQQVVTLRDPATFTYTGTGRPVPFTLHAGIPTVDVTLNGTCRGRFIVDVGNATPMAVNAEQVDACRLFGGNRKEVQHWVGGIGGAFPETVCRLDSVSVGPFSWPEPVAGLTLHHLGGAGSREIQGNLGTSVLDRFVCTFDYARGTLWLQPGARFAARESFSRSGLFLVRWSGRVYIAGVVRHSPAADAGFKVRDVVKAVDGKPVERWTPEQLLALFRDGTVGTTVVVTVERDLRDQDIELTLADVL